jgi:hypothetical protein
MKILYRYLQIVIYYSLDEDLVKFNELRQNISTLCSPESKPQMVDKAIEKFNKCFVSLYNIEGLKDISDVRVEAFNIVTTVIESLALLNQTYLKKGWGKNFEQVLSFKIKPNNLGELVNFQYDKLSILKKAVVDLQVKFVDVLASNNVKIKNFSTLEEYDNYVSTTF